MPASSNSAICEATFMHYTRAGLVRAYGVGEARAYVGVSPDGYSERSSFVAVRDVFVLASIWGIYQALSLTRPQNGPLRGYGQTLKRGQTKSADLKTTALVTRP